MSGGHWNYRDQTVLDEMQRLDITKLLSVLQECFHEIDLAESSDTSKEEGAKRVYELLRDYGDETWLAA